MIQKYDNIRIWKYNDITIWKYNNIIWYNDEMIYDITI